MLCSEWWAFEVLTFMGGTLGVIELASLTICLNLHSLLFRVPLGITEATSALLGNSIGANNVPLAKRFAGMIFKFAALVVFSLGALVILARSFITDLFATEENLVAMTSKLVIVLGCCFLVDGMQATLHGPIRALGLQHKAGLIAISCYWLIGLPLAAILAFKCDYGVYGLMSGFSSATITEAIAFAIIVKRKNWQQAAKESQARIEAQNDKDLDLKAMTWEYDDEFARVK